MKYITFFFWGISLSFSAFSQALEAPLDEKGVQEKNMNYFSQASSPGRLLTFQPRVKTVEGSPYLVEGQMIGRLLTADSVLINDMTFKYNSHEDCVEITTKGERVNLFAHKIIGFSFYDPEQNELRVFVNGFKNYMDNFSPLTYYEILYNGDVKLLAKHDKPVIKIPSKINAPGINTNTATSQYSYIKRIYLKDGDSFIPIKFNRSSIMESIGNAEIRRFLKENKNKCRTLDEVVAVLQHYEKLKKEVK